MPKRRPQINFQVEPALKTLYHEAHLAGHWVTRLCAAGLLLLVEDPLARLRALNRLREWESQFADATPERIRRFVSGAQAALRGSAQGSPPARKARRPQKKATRAAGE